jgi:hypothetical protein
MGGNNDDTSDGGIWGRSHRRLGYVPRCLEILTVAIWSNGSLAKWRAEAMLLIAAARTPPSANCLLHAEVEGTRVARFGQRAYSRIQKILLARSSPVDARWGSGAMKDGTYFAHRIAMRDSDNRVVEHLAGIEDYLLAIATYQAARRRWPDAHVKLTRLTCPNHLRPRHNRGPGIASVAGSQENLPVQKDRRQHQPCAAPR